MHVVPSGENRRVESTAGMVRREAGFQQTAGEREAGDWAPSRGRNCAAVANSAVSVGFYRLISESSGSSGCSH